MGGEVFWRSVDLTGNQTNVLLTESDVQFWRSVDLTGNQTVECILPLTGQFWRSVDLTGNQTHNEDAHHGC